MLINFILLLICCCCYYFIIVVIITDFVIIIIIIDFIFQVLEEVDLDEDGCLSYIEFEHVISRAPDFLKYVYFIVLIGTDMYIYIKKMC